MRAVQRVGRGDGHHLDIFLAQHFLVIQEDARDTIFLRQFRRMAGRGRAHRHHFGLFRHDLKRCRVDVALKLRSDDSDFDFAV